MKWLNNLLITTLVIIMGLFLRASHNHNDTWAFIYGGLTVINAVGIIHTMGREDKTGMD